MTKTVFICDVCKTTIDKPNKLIKCYGDIQDYPSAKAVLHQYPLDMCEDCYKIMQQTYNEFINSNGMSLRKNIKAKAKDKNEKKKRLRK